ncbi:hypothetical protein RZS08_00835, partial [Arthrospira platensis SPKY1]|nr:hypothetical protein [Arthrospira platensis SPKY1]
LTNPHDPGDLRDKLYFGITLNRAEAEARLRELFGIVQHNDIHRWGEDFLDAVESSVVAAQAAVSIPETDTAGSTL